MATLSNSTISNEGTLKSFRDLNELPKNIHVYDNAIPFADAEDWFRLTSNLSFAIGWSDRYSTDRRQGCLHHKMTVVPNNIYETFKPILNHYLDTEKPLESYSVTGVINLTKPGDIHFTHTHKNKLVLLYYLNLDWEQEFYGETLFMDYDNNDACVCVIPKPRRVVIFDGNIPHTIRPQSSLGPQFRYSMTLIFNQPWNNFAKKS